MKLIFQMLPLFLCSLAAVAQVQIQFNSSARYLGDVTVVKVSGLRPRTNYLLRAVVGNDKMLLQSSVIMASDAFGKIATNKTAATYGSYVGVDPDGLFWSMKPVKPQTTVSSGFHFSIELNGQVLATANLPVGSFREGVQKISVRQNGLVGTLYLPSRNLGPRPVIMTYSGSEGGLSGSEFVAAALANKGYASLALAYFNTPGLPSSLANISLDYFEKAIHYLKNQSLVNGQKIAVMGPSRGGELSLLLGSVFPEIKAVVAQVPSHYRWAGNVDATPSPPAWLFAGLQLDFLSVGGDLEVRTLPDGRTVYANTPAFYRGLTQASKADLVRAESLIEKTNGPILLLGGDDDQVWPSCLLAELAFDRLKRFHRKYNDEYLCFKNAGHGVTVLPGFPTMDSALFHPTMKKWMLLGGTPEGNAHGQRAAWQKTLEFLRKNL